jgi:acyl carrier protein
VIAVDSRFSFYLRGGVSVSVEKKVKGIISDQLEVAVDKLSMETTFEDIDADSLDIVELVMALEEEFDLEISDQEIENIKTVGDIVKYIESKV